IYLQCEAQSSLLRGRETQLETAAKMGFPLELIIGKVTKPFCCPSCNLLPENVVETNCGKLYCRKCFESTQLSEEDLRRLNDIVEGHLNTLRIKWLFVESGCRQMMRLTDFRSHIKVCPQNPDLYKQCTNICRLKIKRRCVDEEFPEHDCISSLIEDI